MFMDIFFFTQTINPDIKDKFSFMQEVEGTHVKSFSFTQEIETLQCRKTHVFLEEIEQSVDSKEIVRVRN